MNIVLTKKEELVNAQYPNNKEVGNMKVGKFIDYPIIGQPFYVGCRFRTSVVTEIIDKNTFKTRNSIYTFKELK